jgi:hypothetical protein
MKKAGIFVSWLHCLIRNPDTISWYWYKKQTSSYKVSLKMEALLNGA